MNPPEPPNMGKQAVERAVMGFRVFTAVFGTAAGAIWIATTSAVSQCNSSLGLIAQGLDQGTAAHCHTATLTHTVFGVLALTSIVAILVSLPVGKGH